MATESHSPGRLESKWVLEKRQQPFVVGSMVSVNEAMASPSVISGESEMPNARQHISTAFAKLKIRTTMRIGVLNSSLQCSGVVWLRQ